MRAHAFLFLCALAAASSLPLDTPSMASQQLADRTDLDIDGAILDTAVRKHSIPVIGLAVPIAFGTPRIKRSPQIATRRRFLRIQPPTASDKNATSLPNHVLEYEFNVFTDDELRTQGLH